MEAAGPSAFDSVVATLDAGAECRPMPDDPLARHAKAADADD
jgi:hypothetical protein